MGINVSVTDLFRRLWNHINKRRHKQLLLLFILMIVASLAEIISIGAVFPFLAALTAPEKIFELSIAQPIIRVLGLSSATQILLPLSIMFGVAALLSGVIRLLLVWASTTLSYGIGADLGIKIFRNTLYQPYSVHTSRNSSEIISGITDKTYVVITALSSVLNIMSSVIIMIAILVMLVSVDPVIALCSFGGFAFLYGSIVLITRKKLATNSMHIANETTRLIKTLQEGLGGIRDVLIDGSQEVHCKIYKKADIPLRRAQGDNQFIRSSPRYALEALGMMLIALLAYSMVQQPEGLSKAIPVIGMLALGAQRILPILQQAYGSWTSIKGYQESFKDALVLLDQPMPDYFDSPFSSELPFRKQIELKNLTFRYASQDSNVLTNLNLTIPKGSCVGFIGITGSGKSTLLDIIMGLLQPNSGTIAIDGLPLTEKNYRSWQAHIAHVPQTIFLADTTIEENIAIGVPAEKIDRNRVIDSARKAQIADIIESWPAGYQTKVGERGVRLSGGQRQRIGIARALYKQADVIIFDEATSALDNATESAVMEAIDTLGDELTILIIAHRLTTLKQCSKIIELADGHIIREGSYCDIIAQEEQATL